MTRSPYPGPFDEPACPTCHGSGNAPRASQPAHRGPTLSRVGFNDPVPSRYAPDRTPAPVPAAAEADVERVARAIKPIDWEAFDIIDTAEAVGWSPTYKKWLRSVIDDSRLKARRAIAALPSRKSVPIEFTFDAEGLRKAVLEEAARWHDRMFVKTYTGSNSGILHRESAAAIRAMKGDEHG